VSLPLHGRVALVTSGAKGLGKAVSRALAEAGADVAVTVRSHVEASRDMEREVRSLGREILVVRADAGREDEVEAVFREVDRRFGRLDILVNAVGPYVFERRELADYDLVTWRSLFEGNLTSVFLHARAAVPRMERGHFGRIVNFGFAEAAHLPPWPYRAPYAAFKEGVVSLSRSLAREVAQRGITVNVIAPGRILDPFKEARIEEAQSEGPGLSPVGRTGTGEDVGRVVAFLADPRSDFLTGNVIQIDGGEDVLHGAKADLR